MRGKNCTNEWPARAGIPRHASPRENITMASWNERGARGNKVETDTSRVQFRIICAFVVFLPSSFVIRTKKKIIIIIIIERRSGNTTTGKVENAVLQGPRL